MGETTATRREVSVLKIWKNVKLVTIIRVTVMFRGCLQLLCFKEVSIYSNDVGDIFI